MKVSGKERFAAQISALPSALRVEIRKALDLSAEETVDLMRRFAPRKTGALRNSIGYTFGNAPKGSSIVASAARSAKGDAGMAVTMFAGNADAFYARFQEFGTTEMSANPFFYPAYRIGRKRAKPRLARAVRLGAKKAFAK